MPKCGSQITLCDLPIRFDTYKGCSHGCSYCFAQKKTNISIIEKSETGKALTDFINGKRTTETNWCDWDIPLHWGGMSDPFQPIEKHLGISLSCLKIFKDTQYPFVVSTKGTLMCDGGYLELLTGCNCVIQISLVCPEFDKIEIGAPPFCERLRAIEKLAKFRRVNIRIQPYMPEMHDSIMQSIRLFSEAGAHGIIVEAMKYATKKDGLMKVGGDWCYPLNDLLVKFNEMKDAAHQYGMVFYCGENRLRAMGDYLCCCGIEGMKGFKGNTFNINHIINGGVEMPTKKMVTKGTANVFQSLYQMAGISTLIKDVSFKDMMISEYVNKTRYYMDMLGCAD